MSLPALVSIPANRFDDRVQRPGQTGQRPLSIRPEARSPVRRTECATGFP